MKIIGAQREKVDERPEIMNIFDIFWTLNTYLKSQGNEGEMTHKSPSLAHPMVPLG